MSSITNFFKCFLSQSLNAGDDVSVIYVDRITNAQGETITTSDFADFSRGILTVNPNADGVSEYPENISFSAIDSSALSFTGAIRGLNKGGVKTTSLMRYHPVGTPVIISVGTHNLQDIKIYIDNQISIAAIGTSNVVAGTAGETISQGNLLYLKNDGKWWLADADTITTIENVQLGIAQGAGTTGATITGGVMLQGLDTHQSGLSAGTTYYASNTAGAISSSVGTNTKIIGIGRSSTSIYFNPDFNDAVALQNSLYTYAADSVGTDSYAITLSPAVGSLSTGLKLNFKAGTANTGACTLAVNGLTAKSIKKNVSDDLITGDILANQIITVIYDGTNFQLLSKTPTLVPTIQTFTSNGTWTKPAGLKYIDVELVGGGGGGAGNTTLGFTSSGGGGGGYSRKIIPAASLGATETVTVGTGGSAGAGTGGNGGTGGTTSFGSHLQATGGTGGTASNAAGSGGIGSGGDINLSGGGGAGGGGRANGEAGGSGGSSILGGGAAATNADAGDNSGLTGGNYGGGGSGAHSGGGNDTSGGQGAGGFVKVIEYY